MKKSFWLTATAATLTAFIGTPAFAATVIDQSNTDASVYMAGFSQGSLAQSFTPSKATSAGAGIFLQANAGTTDTVTITLWDKLPNVAGATSLASGSVQGTAGSWADVFWNTVSIVPSSTYYLVFSGNTSLGIAGSTANPYAGGMTYANAGYQAFAGYDYAFRTYADATPAVPEPASWAMMILGMGAVGFAMRRRQNVRTTVSYA